MTRVFLLLLLVATPLSAQEIYGAGSQVVTVYSCQAADSLLGPATGSIQLHALSAAEPMVSFHLASTKEDLSRDRTQIMIDIDAMDLPVAGGAPATARLILNDTNDTPDTLSYSTAEGASGALPLHLTPMKSSGRLVANMAATTVSPDILRGWASTKELVLKAGHTTLKPSRALLRYVAAAFRASVCGVGPDRTSGTKAKD